MNTYKRNLTYKEFEEIYMGVFTNIYQFWNEIMQDEMSQHCMPWSTGRFDFFVYLEKSCIRYYNAYKLIDKYRECNDDNNCKILDIGGFFCMFPLTLNKMGYDVSITESLKYYSDAFNPLFDFIRETGVTVHDVDCFDDKAEINEHFDVVLCLAVLEHYPHSLHTIMKNMYKLLSQNGYIVLEVPNIAYLPKRLDLLLGKSPLVPIEDIYNSLIPFIGHHHEFTKRELVQLLTMSNFEINEIIMFNYSTEMNYRLKNIVLNALAATIPYSKECIMSIAHKCD